VASVKPSQANYQPPIHQGGLKKSHFNREFELEYKSNITALEPLKTASDCPLCELIVATSSLGRRGRQALCNILQADLPMSQMQTIGVTLESRQGKVFSCPKEQGVIRLEANNSLVIVEKAGIVQGRRKSEFSIWCWG